MCSIIKHKAVEVSSMMTTLVINALIDEDEISPAVK